jgi:hypothetical protein
MNGSQYRQHIIQILEDEFPQPADLPTVLTGGGSIEARMERHEQIMQLSTDPERFFATMAHSATHVNDKEWRDRIKTVAINLLASGSELPPSARAWLIFVLSNLDDVPHFAMGSKGKPVAPFKRVRDIFDLAKFLADRHGGKCPEQLSSIDQDAALISLHMSASKVRKLFDSDEFKKTVENFY